MRSRTLPACLSGRDIRQRLASTIAFGMPPVPGTPVRRAAAPAVPGAGGDFKLYVLVTRKGSLTNETVRGIGR